MGFRRVLNSPMAAGIATFSPGSTSWFGRSPWLPGVATSNAARDNRIFRIEENVLNYFGPRSGENIAKVAAIIHKK